MTYKKRKLKSKSKNRKPHAKLGYTELNRNIGTARKLQKANDQEREFRNAA